MCAEVLLVGQSPAAATAAAQPAQAATHPAQTNAKPTSSTPAQAATSAAQTAAVAVGDGQNQAITQETAALLKMATDLQAEMNKTKPYTLSLAVVRKAGEIEQLAKRIRGQP